MTRFTLTGPRGGRAVSITWEDGTVTGDAEAVAAFYRLATSHPWA